MQVLLCSTMFVKVLQLVLREHFYYHHKTTSANSSYVSVDRDDEQPLTDHINQYIH